MTSHVTPTETQTIMGHFCKKATRVLYENAQFVISSARPFSVFRCVPVSKFEKDRGEYNEKQVKT